MKHVLKTTTLILMTAMFFVGCGKSNNSEKSVAATGLTGVCTNCQGLGTTQEIMRAQLKSADGSLVGQVALHGEKVAANAALFEAQRMGHPDPRKSVIYYSGPVMLAGQLQVSRAMPVGSCVIPAGSYQVRTVMMGQMRQSVLAEFQDMEILLDGATDIRLRVTLGFPYMNYSRFYLESFAVQGPIYGYSNSNLGHCGSFGQLILD